MQSIKNMNSDSHSTIQLSVEEPVGTIGDGNASQYRQREHTRDSADVQIEIEYVPAASVLDADKGEGIKTGVIGKLLSSQTISKSELKEVYSEILMLERIIATLQNDNEVLRGNNRDLSLKNVELSDYIANLEAKHSLLISNVEGEAQVNKKRADDIQKLTITINELKRKYEEAGNAKKELWDRLNSVESKATEDKCTLTDLSVVTETSVTGGLPPNYNDSKGVSWAKGDTNTQEVGLSDRRKMTKKNREDKGIQANTSNLKTSPQHKQTTHVSNIIPDSKRLEENRLLKMKDSRIRQLEDALMEKEKYMVSALQRLKDESDTLCLQYKEKISRLELQLKDKKQVKEIDKEITQNQYSTDSETVLLKERLSKCEKLLSDNYRFIDLLNKQWERSLEDVKKNHSEQLKLIHENHNNEIIRLQSNQQLELDRISKMKHINGDTESLNHKLLKMASGSKHENFLLAVLDRINYLEKRCKQREEDVAFEIAESKRVAEIERRLHMEKMSLTIEHKNNQIKLFQIELDELLTRIKPLADFRTLFNSQID